MDVARLTGALAEAGFDIVHPFAAHAVAREPGWESLATGGALGLLVGNTRVLWEWLARARARDADLAAASDPIDRYTETTLEALGLPALFAHRMYGGTYLPFQRLAVAAGLAALAPSQLLVHPTFGPWFALRALVVIDADAPPPPTPIARPCTCEAGCVAAFERACARPDDWRAWLVIRDTCPIGRAFRYDDDQIAYHYTKAPQFLPRARDLPARSG